MTEWSIALPWKGSNWATGSGVRIPVSPPNLDSSKVLFYQKIDKDYSLILQLMGGQKKQMNESYIKIADALNTIYEIENELNLKSFSPNELKVFYTVINLSAFDDSGSNISEVVKNSGMSRSTVYKTLKKLSNLKIIATDQSENDGRESLIRLT